tara:strand:- start:917 stop:1858 length:942 start_codon:yes stop_codon:yes gene_type:complete
MQNNKFKTTMGSHIPVVESSIKNLIYIFTSLKYTKYKVLNILGLQIFRYLGSKLMYFINSLKFKGNKLYPSYDQFGYHVIPDILPEGQLDRLKIEFEKCIKHKSQDLFNQETNKQMTEIHIDPILENKSVEMHAHEFKFKEDEIKEFPEMYKLYKSQFLNDLFSFAEKKTNPIITMRLERVIQKDDFVNEFNTLWHMDTFHDTHKGYLYLTEVKKENGPFTYLISSCRFSFRSLYMEYKNSIKFALNKSTRSFRIFDTDANFPKDEIKEIICKPNTFLIANTLGLHRRGNAIKGSVRDAIHFWTRENPFKIKK